jgi:hypothetical protein
VAVALPGSSLLIANRRVALHRRLGLTSVVLLALMIPLGFTTTTAMIRRGFDLSGDQHVDPHPDGRTAQDAHCSVCNLPHCWRSSFSPMRQLAIVAGQTSTSSSCCLRISRSWLRRSRTWPVTYRASHHRRHRLQFLILCSVAFDYLTEKRVRSLPRNVEIIVRLARDCSRVGCPSYCDTYAAFFPA